MPLRRGRAHHPCPLTVAPRPLPPGARVEVWSASPRRRGLKPSSTQGPSRAIVAAALLVAGCAAGPRARAPLLAAPVDASPGASPAAWSPDGTALAVVQPGGVRVLDLARGTSRVVSGPGAVSVDWAPAPSLLVAERDARGGRVVAVAPDGAERRVLHENPGVVSATWLHGGAGWAAIAEKVEVRSYGTTVSLALTVATGGSPSTALAWTTVLPTKDRSADPGLGWRAARPNPIDHGFLVPQYRKPPLLAASVELVSVDSLDPEPRSVARLEGAGFGAAASWSPDGRRAAIAGGDGTLRVLAKDGSLAVTTGPARGLLPAWHPAADVVFLGGALVDPAGAPLRTLVTDAPGAVGAWSPAGDRIAVAAGGRLFVFGTPDLGAPAVEARRGRAKVSAALWDLGALRAEGLVAPAVYRERRDRVRSRTEER